MSSEAEYLCVAQQQAKGICRDSSVWPGKHWAASPIRVPLDLLRKCPRTSIIVAEQDLLRAETFQFAQKLQEANVHLDIREYEGAPHMFLAMDKVLESGMWAVEDLVERVKEILAEYLEHSVIKPSGVHNELDRQNLLEHAQKIQGHLTDGELVTNFPASKAHACLGIGLGGAALALGARRLSFVPS